MSERKKKVTGLMKEALKGSKKKASSSKADTTPKADFYVDVDGTISINGDGNTVAGRDIYINKKEIKRYSVTPSPDCITPAQKQTIKEKITEIVERSAIAGGNRKALFPFWWSKLQKKFRVNSYQEILQYQYDAVMTWLSQQKAISRPKLRRPANDTWRNELYAAIWARQKELGMSKEWVYSAVYEKLGKVVSSLTELGERDLKKLYDLIIKIKQ
jgi:hypothetical protein